MRLVLLSAVFCPVLTKAQISIPNATPLTENFNAMGTSATAALPANWKLSVAGAVAPTWSAVGNFTAVNAQASSGSPTTGARYNWGTSTTERALGVMTSGSYASPNSIMAYYRNTNPGNNLTSISVSYDLERYRINTAAASVQFFYSTDGSAWTAVSAGDIAALTTGASSYSYAPLSVSNPSPNNPFTVTFASPIATNGDFYLRWNLNTTGSNSQGIGIDNVSVTGTFTAAPPTVTISSPSQLGAGNIGINTADNVISQFQLAATGTISLSQVDIPFGGTYTSNDISDLKLWYNTTSNTFPSGAAQFDVTKTAASTGSGETISFAGSLSLPAITYFFVTATSLPTATANRTINTGSLDNSKFTFSPVTAASGSATAPADQTIVAAVPPTLTPASPATVDDPFIDLSFNPDDQNWRDNITDVKVGLVSLPPAAYDITIPGLLRLIPSQSSLLQSSGLKVITAISTGYGDDVVNQQIDPGVPASLTVSTQPTAPASSGAVLATQPAVTVLDQYSNPVATGQPINAIVTSGQGSSWSLGGTVAANTNGSGIATFTNLTATNLTAGIYSATIDFYPDFGTGTATSNSFNIPAPPLTYVSMTASPLSYAQDFNTLINTGSGTWTDNSTIPFWYAQRSGTGTSIAADAGSGTAGNLYSYGTGTNVDRALGSIGSSNAAAGNFAWGVLLKNLTGSPVTLKVSYTGEQWRNSAAAAQTVGFYYKTSSSAFTALNPNVNTGWTAVSGLNFVSPVTGGVAGALVGNTAPNFTTVSNIPVGVTVAPNDYIMLKWDDPDHQPGSDHGLATDDVTISWELPSVTISSPSQVGANNVSVGSVDNIISAFQMVGAVGGGNLTQVNVPLNGTYTSTDVSNLKLWYNNSSNTLTGATQFGATASSASTGTGETIGFIGAAAISGTVYFFVTTDIELTAVSARTINADAMTTSNFTFDPGPAISGSVTAGGAQTIQAGVAPTLVAAVGATVDNNIDITFSPDDATWRGNITDIKVGASSLPLAAYDVSNAGIVRLIPSQSALLQTPGTKSITVISTGYTNAAVNQSIAVGAANKLFVSTQPSTSVNNGTPLTVQPWVVVQDQYGNTAATPATVNAQVGAGSWTLSGTTGVGTVLDTAKYTNLTANTAAAVTGATILFTSPGLTQVYSNPFNIPVADYFSLNAINVTSTENFTSLGSSATAVLPPGFHVNTTASWNSGTAATTAAAGTTGTGILTGTSGGGVYNYANGVTATSTDRALGFLTSGSFSSPRSIILKMHNNTGSTITALDIAFDYEKYRSGSRAWDWTFFSGVIESPVSAVATGNQSYIADANNTTISNPPTSISKSVTISGLNVAAGADYYVRWTYTGNGGATNAQGLGIDNLSVTPKTCYIWSGGNGNWSTPGNWQCGVVPTLGTEAISIPAGSPVLDVDFTVLAAGSLTLSGTGGLTIAAGKTLTIAGTADFAGLPVTIQSTASGTGAIGRITGTLSGETNVTVERYVPAKRAWRLFTIPVTSSTKTVRDAWANHAPNGSAPAGEVAGSGTLITGTAYGTGAAATTAGFDWWASIANTASSIRRYIITGSSGDWPAYSDNNPINVPGTLLNAAEQGYMLFVRGDRTITTGAGATTLKPTGTLRKGTQSYSIPAPGTAAYKVIGNPYASTISFESLMANGVNSTRARNNRFWIWDANNGSTGAYRLVNKLGAGNWERIPAAMSETAPSYAEYIRSGQAFLVETLTAGTNDFTIDEDDKPITLAGNPPAVFDIANAGRFYCNLNLNDNGTLTLSDGVLAVYDAGALNSLDDNDVEKPDNFSESISILRYGKHLILETRDVISDKDTLFFLMSNIIPRKYAFQFKGVQMQPGLIAKLQDLYLGEETDIVVTGDIVTVPFDVTADASSAAGDRFRVVFKADPTLPLTLTNAKAYSLNNGVQVDWKTVNEAGIRSYEVEKSTDGRSFTTANTIAATGAGNYGWFDAAPVKGNNYYRIKGISTSGEVTYSQVLMVNLNAVKAGFAIYPNPVKGSNAGVQFSNMEKGKYGLVVYNNAGQKVFAKEIQHLGGSATEDIKFGSAMAAGVYRVSLVSSNGSVQNQTLVLQK